MCGGSPEDLEWFAQLVESKYEVTRKTIQKAGEELTYLGRTYGRPDTSLSGKLARANLRRWWPSGE